MSEDVIAQVPTSGTPPAAVVAPVDTGVPTGTSPAATVTEPAAVLAATPDFIVPEAYKEKPWAAKIKSPDDLWKQVEGLQSVVGKKHLTPDFTTATPEEVENYFKEIRPKDKADYKLPDNTTEQMKNTQAEMFYDSGLNVYQAEKLAKRYREHEDGVIREMTDRTKFSEMLKTTHGDQTTKVIDLVNRSAEINLGVDSEEYKSIYRLPNQSLVGIYTLVNKILAQHGITEIGAAGGTGGGGSSTDYVADAAGIRKQIIEIDRRPHTTQEKQTLIDKLHQVNMRQIQITKK